MERNSHWIKKAGAKSSWLLWLDSDHQKSENKGELSDTGHIFQKVSKLLFFKGSSSNIWFFPDFFIWSFISEYLVVGPIGCRPYCGFFSPSPPPSPCKPIINKEPHFRYLNTATHISYIVGTRRTPGFIGRWPRRWQRHTERQIQRQRRGQIFQ